MEQGCKAGSYKAGHATSSTSGQDSRAKHCIIKQYTLLDWLVDAEAWPKQADDAMVVNEPAKPVAGSSKHPNNVDIIDSELIY